MDEFWTIVGNMTFWNWLALIAFLFGMLGALNAFLGLRSRYLDWRGTKSKKNFELRVKQLDETLSQVQEFENNPTKFFVYILSRFSRILIVFLAGSLSFIIGFFLTTLVPLRSSNYSGALFMLAGFFMTLAFVGALWLDQPISMIYNPTILVEKITKFTDDALKKGLIKDPEIKSLSEALVSKSLLLKRFPAKEKPD